MYYDVVILAQNDNSKDTLLVSTLNLTVPFS